MSSLITASTQRNVDMYLKNPYPALLISGPIGSGKKVIINEIIDRLYENIPNRIRESSIIILGDQNASISIDDVRKIKAFLKLAPTKHTNYRCVIIHDAELLTDEAQNALLKILEETPQKTLFILTSSNTALLLETVQSRLQKIVVARPLISEILSTYNNTFSEREIKQAYMMCDGRLRYIDEILNNENSEYRSIINDAKKLVTMTTYERLCQIERILHDYPIDTYLLALKTIYKSVLRASNTKKQTEQRASALRKIVNAESVVLASNPNKKLLLTNLMLNI